MFDNLPVLRITILYWFYEENFSAREKAFFLNFTWQRAYTRMVNWDILVLWGTEFVYVMWCGAKETNVENTFFGKDP